MNRPSSAYVGRLAPSPTGYLHLGHAQTFWLASERARLAGGKLLLRSDDLDRARCRPEFVAAFEEDLAWLGLRWQGPIVAQSDRLSRYRAALASLHAQRLIFPCLRSRRDVAAAAGAPHEAPGGEGDEPLYPREWRPRREEPLPPLTDPITINWRFRVPDGEALHFVDGMQGLQTAIAGVDFADFLVWRKDDVPGYQLACAVDDAELAVTEVVRGADLVKSTFRQILLLRALGHPVPDYVHCPLLLDERGQRLAKRHDALSLRALRASGMTPEVVRSRFRFASEPQT